MQESADSVMDWRKAIKKEAGASFYTGLQTVCRLIAIIVIKTNKSIAIAGCYFNTRVSGIIRNPLRPVQVKVCNTATVLNL